MVRDSLLEPTGVNDDDRNPNFDDPKFQSSHQLILRFRRTSLTTEITRPTEDSRIQQYGKPKTGNYEGDF